MRCYRDKETDLKIYTSSSLLCMTLPKDSRIPATHPSQSRWILREAVPTLRRPMRTSKERSEISRANSSVPWEELVPKELTWITRISRWRCLKHTSRSSRSKASNLREGHQMTIVSVSVRWMLVSIILPIEAQGSCMSTQMQLMEGIL